MGEENWPKNVVRSKEVLHLPIRRRSLGRVLAEGPRVIVCADCGAAQNDGNVIHLKPEIYAIAWKGETFYLERHLCKSCAAKRGLL